MLLGPNVSGDSSGPAETETTAQDAANRPIVSLFNAGVKPSCRIITES